jgi:hypothetical protein
VVAFILRQVRAAFTEGGTLVEADRSLTEDGERFAREAFAERIDELDVAAGLLDPGGGAAASS